jgi:hypothetical protein
LEGKFVFFEKWSKVIEQSFRLKNKFGKTGDQTWLSKDGTKAKNV